MVHSFCPVKVGVELLSDLCHSYILMHLEELPVSYLSLLPLSERKCLLQRLPIADVCLLEDTDFMNDIDMENYWRLPATEFVEVEESEYFIEQWGRAKFAKAILYGEVAAMVIDCLPGGFWFLFAHGKKYIQIEDLIVFLYAVRKFAESECWFTYPSHYEAMLCLDEKDVIVPEEILDATVKCFRGELPKILNRVFVDDNTQLKYEFLCELRLLCILGIEWDGVGMSSLDFVQGILEEARHLKVLVLEGDDYSTCSKTNDSRLHLGHFCSNLSSYPTFLSKFRVLKLLSCTPGYSISQKKFNQLISAYLSAPTGHAQTMRFTGVKIETHEMCSIPRFDQRYLQLKTIELHHCRFVSEYSATCEAISHWLGQSINIVANKDCDVCSFQVGSDGSHKRRHSERESTFEAED